MRIRVVLILLCCSLYSWGVRFSDTQIDKMIERLTLSKETNLENGIAPHSERAKYYDVLGHLNSMNHPSVQVRIDEQGKCTKLVVMP